MLASKNTLCSTLLCKSCLYVAYSYDSVNGKWGHCDGVSQAGMAVQWRPLVAAAAITVRTLFASRFYLERECDKTKSAEKMFTRLYQKLCFGRFLLYIPDIVLYTFYDGNIVWLNRVQYFTNSLHLFHSMLISANC